MQGAFMQFTIGTVYSRISQFITQNFSLHWVFW